MKKLLLFGNKSEKSELMKILHKMGCVEVSLAKKLDNTQYVVDENKINEYTRKLTQLEFLFDFFAETDKVVGKNAKARNYEFKPVKTSGLLIPKMSLTFDEFAKSKEVENEVFEIVEKLEKYSEKHNVSFDKAFSIFAKSQIYNQLFNYETRLWTEGPDYLLKLFEDNIDIS